MLLKNNLLSYLLTYISMQVHFARYENHRCPNPKFHQIPRFLYNCMTNSLRENCVIITEAIKNE